MGFQVRGFGEGQHFKCHACKVFEEVEDGLCVFLVFLGKDLCEFEGAIVDWKETRCRAIVME